MFSLIALFCVRASRTQPAQLFADRFDKDGETTQISIFYSQIAEVTEELLRSSRAYFYSWSTYEVTENIEGKSLLVTLTDPNGNNYRYESGWLYSPDYMAEDIWYLSLAETNLTSILNADGYPAGVYRVAFYVDGLLADEFSFELKQEQ